MSLAAQHCKTGSRLLFDFSNRVNNCHSFHRIIPILVLKENLKSGTYRTMIYCYEGKLRELFQEESMEYKLADGLEVMELNAFGIEQVSDDKLKFTSFDGEESQSLTMFLRSM